MCLNTRWAGLAPGQFPSLPLVTDLAARGTRTERVEDYGHLKTLALTGDVASNGGIMDKW